MGNHNITVEDSSPLIIYADHSAWINSLASSDFSDYSGYAPEFNTYHQTTATTSFHFPFNGTAIYVFGTTSSSGGPYTVSLTPNTLSASSFVEETNDTAFTTTILYQQPLYTRTNLDPTVPHLLSFQNDGGGELTFDFLVVESVANGPDIAREYTIDDADGAFSYTGNWTTDATKGGMPATTLYRQTAHHTDQVNATTSLRFRGSGVAIHGQYSFGTFQAQIDGGRLIPISNYNASSTPVPIERPAELLFMTDGLTEADHVLTLTNLGEGDQTGFNVDYAVVSTGNPNNTNGLSVMPVMSGSSLSTVRTNNAGVIVGGVLGGLALLLVAAVVIYLFMWRKKDKRRDSTRVIDLEDNSDTFTDKLTPWNQPPPPTPFVMVDSREFAAQQNLGPDPIPDEHVPAPAAPRRVRVSSLVVANPSRSLTIAVPARAALIPVPIPPPGSPRPLPSPKPQPQPQPQPPSQRVTSFKRRTDRPSLPANPRTTRPLITTSKGRNIDAAPLSAIPASPGTPRHASDAGFTLVPTPVYPRDEATTSTGKRRTLPPIYDPRWSVGDGAAPPVPEKGLAFRA